MATNGDQAVAQQPEPLSEDEQIREILWGLQQVLERGLGPPWRGSSDSPGNLEVESRLNG
jgi:hypothetical protein